MLFDSLLRGVVGLRARRSGPAGSGDPRRVRGGRTGQSRPRSRRLRCKPLEDRQLLSAVPSAINWATYLGGSDLDSTDYPVSVAFDGTGNPLVTGSTKSSDFEGASNTLHGSGTFDAFVAKVTSTGSLAWATYLGPVGGYGIAVDGAGNVLVSGGAGSTSFPGANNSYRGGNSDAFVLKLNPAACDATKFQVVNDASQDQTCDYNSAVVLNASYSLTSGNTAPRGVATTIAGDKTWVVDASRNVYVYNASGGLLGSWTAGTVASNAIVEDITVCGSDVWIVDAKSDKVFRYTAAATGLSAGCHASRGSWHRAGSTRGVDVSEDGRLALWARCSGYISMTLTPASTGQPSGFCERSARNTQSLKMLTNDSRRAKRN